MWILMWIESMAVVLLFVAGMTAVFARRPRRRTQVLWSIVVAALFLVGAAVKTGAVYALVLYLIITTGWFVYILSWTIIYAAAASVLIVRGLRRGEDGAPKARGWSVGRLAVADGAALALALITFWNIDLTAKTRLAAMRAEVSAIALSVAPARVPDRLNAALVYQKAFEAMASGSDSLPADWDSWIGCKSYDSWLGSTSGAPFDARNAGLRALLKQSEPALALLRRAAAMPDCYFEHDYAQPTLSWHLPDFGQVQYGSRLLWLDARCRAADGNVRGALDDVNCLFAMAAHTRSAPLIVSVLVAASIDAMAAAALEETLASNRPKAEDLAVLTIEESAPYERSMARAFRMEEAFVLGFFSTATGDPEALREVNAAPSYAMEPFASIWRVFLLPDDIASYRRAMQQYAKWTARPYGEAHADWEKWEQEFRSKEAGLFTRMLVPALSGAAKATAEADARHQLACTALAVEKYRAKTGQPPDRLDKLVPDYLDAIPKDPFDGKPLRMAVSQSGILLYSVGPDLKDEGGAAWDDEKHTGNITFRLPAR
jgi:hypothetical protein